MAKNSCHHKESSKSTMLVFQMYPPSQNESLKQAWGECIKAIDVANRQLKRRGKEN